MEARYTDKIKPKRKTAAKGFLWVCTVLHNREDLE